jgi:hypothetical protein
MTPGRRLFLALVHHPVLTADGRTVTTSVTNLDVHDLARSARTYSLAGLLIASPIEAQRRIVEHIVDYWNDPIHAARIPGRREALALVGVVCDIEEARERILAEAGQAPIVIGTSARPGPGRTSWHTLRTAIREAPETVRLIIMGTGWGLADEALRACDEILEPIEQASGYNHLSVRSATAVILDRLVGSERPEGAGT